MLHPHLHCLVTGGGLTPAGQWVAVRHGFLLPMRVVMAVFRGKMVAAIRQTFARGALVLPEPMRPQQFVNLLNRLGHPTKTKWNVRIMERYRHGAGVVTYLARYLRGGPIKNGPAGGVGWGLCHLHLSRARGGVSVRGAPPAADDVAGRRFSPAVAAACAEPPHPGGAVVWPLPSCPHRGACPLSRRARASACGASNGPGLADRVCPTGRRASGTVSHTSYKVANLLVEFSTSIPRTQLRPGYGDGFLGAPLQRVPPHEHPSPRAQGGQRGTSRTQPQDNPGGCASRLSRAG